MSNYVKVSIIGCKHLALDAGLNAEEAVKNMINYLKSKVEQVLPERPDIIVLPEMSDTPVNYSLEKCMEYYMERKERVLDQLAHIARENNCYIAYPSIRLMENGTSRNSIRIIDRNGSVVGIYNKNHPIIPEISENGVLCGKDAPVIECDFGSIACVICFDLNFDTLRLKYVKEKPDLLIFSSMYHGGLMQNYWAYSCRSYFAGAVAGLKSSIISPVGEVIASSTNYHDFTTAVINLDCRVVHLDYNREKLKAMKAKYGPAVMITDPGYLASVLVSSETAESTIDDMIKEFEIELLDDYMKRSLNFQQLESSME